MERPMRNASSPQSVSTATSILIMISILATTLAVSTSPSPTTLAISASDQTTPIPLASPTNQTNRGRIKQRPSGSTKRASLLNRNKPATQLSTASPSTTPHPIASHQDPMLLAQHEARLMAGYGNTPPLLITHTRDLFVDVAKYPLGTRLVTLKASDQEADPMLYSIQPSAYLNQDASPYLSIEPFSGELRLANRIFPFQANRTQTVATNTDCDGEEDCSGEAEQSSSSFVGEFNERTSERRQMFGRNIYFLNVMVSDGQYNTTTEFLIHVINSTYLASSFSSDSSNIQLMPRTNDRPAVVAPKQGNIDQLEGIIHQKTEEFYNRLLEVSSTTKGADETYGDDVRPAVVYPNFVNPSLSRPEPAPDNGPAPQVEELSTVMSPASSGFTNSVSEAPYNLIANSETVAAESKSSSASRGPKDVAVVVEPVMVSMVVFCSCLLIMLVLLLFLVPISVKRLRRRIRHVERQHEQLSQKNSFSADSSIMGHSTVGGSSLSAHHQGGPHHPSLSDFSSSVSTSSNCCKSLLGQHQARPKPVYRQSSLDSTSNQPILSHDTHRMVIQNQAFLMAPPDHNQFIMQQPILHLEDQSFQVDNIYCPIEDELYSTIGVSHHLEQQQEPNFSREFHQAVGRDAESPASIDSCSSTRSLARFLSLPARHAAHNNKADDGEEINIVGKRALDELDCIFKQEPQTAAAAAAAAAKTIARASHISREQRQSKPNDMFVCQPPAIDWELDRNRLKFQKIIGEGQFGLVWRCELRNESGQNNRDGSLKAEQTVAVKTLKNSAGRSERQREELMKEIENMKLVYGHPNVVKILHCCSEINGTTEKPILLVMEYVELGKLQSFLEKSRPKHRFANNLYNNFHATNVDHLTSRDLVRFIYHVAKGMEFVASKGIVHRDLASRNVLVSAQRICKIGDFGMARSMANQTDGVYERHSRSTKIPVRWMAPEVLLNNSFTTKSDVYSFGILMWEIVTLGSTPYWHLKTEQVIEEVARKGERPPQPDYCHKLLFDIMSNCWQESPRQRPTFSRLVKQLDELLLSSNDYIELDQYPDHNYYNISKSVAELV